jgi:Putative peptidoglycan binding domain/D-alanyl-D-alanine carboxypeptidase
MSSVDTAIRSMIADRRVDTGRVRGLSRQIIVEMNNLVSGVLVNFEDLPGLTLSTGKHLNYYLQAGQKDSLRTILKDGMYINPPMRMIINSAYRTVAQQHVLRQIYERGHRDLVPLAARPGKSNHEDGMALDVENYQEWKAFFISNGWQWQGGNDPVHFFENSGRDDIGILGVKAFQRVWNRFNPTDQMTVDGDFGLQSIARMNKAPVEGFIQVGVFREGDKGPEIERIQNALTNAGFPLPSTGNFGPQTKAAVIKFQDKFGLAADGVIGTKTLKALGLLL